MNKLLIWICENSYLTFCIVALLFLLSLLFFGCTTTPATAPPITPEINAKTSDLEGYMRIGPPKDIERWKVYELGKVKISNSTLAVYLVTVRDKQSNIVFKNYVRPGSGFALALRLGEYQVCFKSSGIWGRETCFDKLVETGKVNEWEIKRKRK